MIGTLDAAKQGDRTRELIEVIAGQQHRTERDLAIKSKPSPSTRSKLCIIVAGMHRSGTSATARVVNLLGAHIAGELVPASAGDNDRGFWESRRVVQIHEHLLEALGSSYDTPFPVAENWIKSAAARKAKRQLVAEIQEEFQNSGVFVVKDPRIALLLPMWLQVLDTLKIECVVIVPFRNPLEVAESLSRRNGFALAKSLLMYSHSNLEVELASRGRPRIFLPYDQLLADWRPFVGKLRDLSGRRIPALGAKVTREINHFLTRDLHRNRSSYQELKQRPDVAAMVVEIFRRLSEAAITGNEDPLRKSFNGLRASLAEATKMYRGLVIAQTEKVRGDAARQELTINNLGEEIGRFRAQLQARQLEFEAARAEAAAARIAHEALVAERGSFLAERETIFKEREVFLAERNTLFQEHDAVVRAHNGLVKEREAFLQERTTLFKEHETFLAERDATLKEREAFLAERNTVFKEHDAVVQAHNGLLKEREAFLQERTALFKEHETFLAERDAILKEREAFLQERSTLFKEHEIFLAERDAIRKEGDAFLADRHALFQEHGAVVRAQNGLVEERQAFFQERAVLFKEHEIFLAERDAIRKEREALLAERDALLQERDATVRAHDGLVQERQSLLDELKHLRKEIEAHVAERDTLRDEREALVAERDAIYGSASWKLTAPLRKKVFARGKID
jgi:hypothetical protein